jgi:hypothetical protein
MNIELPVVLWMFIVSQIFGAINIFIAFIKYQYKDKAKTLKLSAVGNVFKALNYAFLMNFSLAGLKVVSVFKNLSFSKTSKGEVKRWLSISIFIFFCLISTAIVVWAWWLSGIWFEWVVLAVVLLANYGKWAKGVHLIRITQLFYCSVMIINGLFFFLNFTSIIKAVAVIISILVFYVRFFKKKCTKPTKVEEDDLQQVIASDQTAVNTAGV